MQRSCGSYLPKSNLFRWCPRVREIILKFVSHLAQTNSKNLLNFFRTTLRYDEVPADMRTECDDRRQELIENVSNVDEALGELFLGKYMSRSSGKLIF